MSTAVRHQYVVAALSIAAAIAAVCAATGIWPELPNVQLLLVACFAIAALYQTRVRAEPPTVTASDEMRAARRDITTLRATQEALAASEQKYRRLFEDSRDMERQMQQAQKMDAVGRLAGGVAHDFNNLLTAITGYAELLISSLSPADARIQDAYEIRRAALSAARLTRQLLTFSRHQRAHTEIVDVNAVVAQTAGMLERTLGEHIGVTLRLDPDLKAVKADTTHLEQIVLNLAVNARDAMPGGGRLTVKTTMHRSDGKGLGVLAAGEYVCLTVTDTGCGIPEALQSRVFEPFFTTKGASGTGLGLATVYGIVKQSGGYVRFESVEGRGTTFMIDLPSTPETAAPKAATQSPRFIEGYGTVLVVDDDRGIREITELVLRRAGHDVVLAAGPREALTAIRGRTDVNLLLTDVLMPEMSGYDLAEEMRKLSPGLRCVFMSGFAGDPFRGLTAEAFLPKPFTVESLTNIVHQTISENAQRHAGHACQSLAVA